MNTYFFDYEPGDRIKNRVTVNFEDAGKKTVDGSVVDLERI